jgi:hypothetical protein
MTRTIAILGIIACAVISAAGGSLFYFGLVPAKKIAAAKPAILEHCHGKVVYLQFETAVVTKLKPDGKVWTCGGA